MKKTLLFLIAVLLTFSGFGQDSISIKLRKAIGKADTVISKEKPYVNKKRLLRRINRKIKWIENYNNDSTYSGFRKFFFQEPFIKQRTYKLKKLEQRANINHTPPVSSTATISANSKQFLGNYTIKPNYYKIGGDSIAITYSVEDTVISPTYDVYKKDTAKANKNKYEQAAYLHLQSNSNLKYNNKDTTTKTIELIISTDLQYLYKSQNQSINNDTLAKNNDSLAKLAAHYLKPFIDTLRYSYPQGILNKKNPYLVLRANALIQQYNNGNLIADILDNQLSCERDIVDTIGYYQAQIDSSLSGLSKNIATWKKANASISQLPKSNDLSKSLTTKIDSLAAIQTILSQDSASLNSMIVGKHTGIGFNAAYFQSIPNLSDDNPKNYSSYHLNLNFPLRKIDGAIKNSCNCKKAKWVAVRNFQTSFQGNFSNDKYGAYEYVDSLKTGIKQYVNLLDLSQYAFFTATANLNLVTAIGKHYEWYFDGFFTVSRTNIYNSKDSSKQPNLSIKDSAGARNIGLYGISITGRTKFKCPLNARINAQVFWIDPATNNNSLLFLNAQYNKITTDAPQPATTYSTIATLPNAQKQVYATIKFTLQYNTSPTNNSCSKSTNSISSSISSNSPSFIFATFGFTSSFFPQRGHDVNSYVTLQIGYSMTIQKIISSIQAISGFGSSNTSASSSTTKSN